MTDGFKSWSEERIIRLFRYGDWCFSFMQIIQNYSGDFEPVGVNVWIDELINWLTH